MEEKQAQSKNCSPDQLKRDRNAARARIVPVGGALPISSCATMVTRRPFTFPYFPSSTTGIKVIQASHGITIPQ